MKGKLRTNKRTSDKKHMKVLDRPLLAHEVAAARLGEGHAEYLGRPCSIYV